MELVYVGKIVNTHGIKGELRIISKFERISDVFKVGNEIYIGEEHIKEKIASYRHHKQFEIFTERCLYR